MENFKNIKNAEPCLIALFNQGYYFVSSRISFIFIMSYVIYSVTTVILSVYSSTGSSRGPIPSRDFW